MTPTTQEFGPCPCGVRRLVMGDDMVMRGVPACGVQGTKLKRNGHLVGCKCRPCIGTRNKRKGQKAQSKVLKRAAAAQGITMEVAPTHEEQARLLVHYESKQGEQVWRATGGRMQGGALLKKWEKQAKDFADRQTPRRKWALVMTFPGGEERIWMDYKQWLSLVAEIMESV